MKYFVTAICILLSLLPDISAQDNKGTIRSGADQATRAAIKAIHTGGDSIRWTKGGSFSFGVTQNSYHDWVEGGENNASGSLNLEWYFNYRKNKITWENLFRGGLGRLYQGSKFIKSSDYFELNSKVSYRITRKWSYTANSKFQSQFGPMYNYGKDTTKRSDFMIPAYLFVRIGMDYKPHSSISIVGAPFMGKSTFVGTNELRLQKQYGMKIKKDENGVEYGEKRKHEWGGGVNIAYNKALVRNVILSSNADFFSNYKHQPSNIDVELFFNINMPINQIMSTNLTFQGRYDNDIKIDGHGPKFQWRQNMIINFNMSLSNPRDLIPTRVLRRNLNNAEL